MFTQLIVLPYDYQIVEVVLDNSYRVERRLKRKYMKFNFRKVSAVASSLLMLGLTAGVASAATFPAPFSSSTSSGVGVVSGTGAGVSDSVATSSISNYLATMVRSSGGVPTGGDSVLLAKSSDNLNLGNTWGVFTGTIDDDDLATILADGEYIADDNDNFDFEQKITLGTPTLTHFRDSDYESLVGLSDRTPVVGFKFSSNTFVMNYTLDFIQDAESDVVSGDLDDIEGSDITLFGKTFYVSDAKNGTVSGSFGKWTLLDSAVTSNVAEGETASVDVEGTTYSVSLDFIGSSTVKFNVNGELTNTLSAGQTFRLADNAYIGVREINTQDYQGGIKTVEFSIGSGKLELTHAADVKLNDDTLQGVKAYLIKGSYTDGVAKVDKIAIEWKTDEEEFVSPETELEMPGFGGVKFTMADFFRQEEDKVVIQTDGDNSIEMIVPIKDGTVSFNLLFSDANANAGNFTGLGKASDERLKTSNNATLTFLEKDSAGNDLDEWFVASYNTTSQAESYLLRAKVNADTTNNRNETTIQKHNGAAWVDVCVEKIATDTCDIGDVSLTIDAVAHIAGAEESITITAGTDVNFNTIYTKGGLRIYLPFTVTDNTTIINGAINLTAGTSGITGHDPDSWYLFMDGEDKDDNIASGTEFNLTIDSTSGTGNPLQVSQVSFAGTGGPNGLEMGDTRTYETYIVDDVAPRILHYTSADEDTAEVYYPMGDSESFATVFLTEIGSVVSGTAGNMVFTDAEKSSWQGRNVVLVGGSCINSATAEALGHAYPTCASAWEAATGVGSGQFLVQSMGSAFTSGKIALVVAGYSESDTAAGASRLTNQPGTIDTTAGNKYIFAATTTGGSTRLSGP